MQHNRLYKHIANKDVAFAPTSTLYETLERIGYQGMWFNIANKDRPPITIDVDKIHVNKEDLPNWIEYNPGHYF